MASIKVMADPLRFKDADLSTKLHVERVKETLYRFSTFVRKKLNGEINVNNLCECMHASVSTTRANYIWLFF